jgi:hypothetical protein
VGDPLAAAGAEDRVEGGDHARDGGQALDAVADVLVQVRFAIGDDEELVPAKAVAD